MASRDTGPKNPAAPTSPTLRRDQHEWFARANGFAGAEWRALGTTAHLVVTDPDGLPEARRAVDAVVQRMDLAASRFRADSGLAAVNRGGGAWTPVSPTLLQALRVALDAAQWTDGLVDPTVGGALMDLGYDRTFSQVQLDAPAAVVTVRSVPGWRQVELDEDRGMVRVPASTIIDLGATAKGLAADLAADAAAAATGCGVLVNLGGDVSVSGPAPAGGWPVTVGDTSALDQPVGRELEQTVAVGAGGLATSSTQARRWRRGGFPVHHLIDPRLGRPSASPWRTVTVAAATCTLANAASTASIIMGAAAPTWLAEHALPARLVGREGSVRVVAGWPLAPDGAER